MVSKLFANWYPANPRRLVSSKSKALNRYLRNVSQLVSNRINHRHIGLLTSSHINHLVSCHPRHYTSWYPLGQSVSSQSQALHQLVSNVSFQLSSSIRLIDKNAVVAQPLGLLDAFPRRSDGWYLLMLGRQRSEGLRYEVGVGGNHVLPSGCVHDVCCVTPEITNFRLDYILEELKIN